MEIALSDYTLRQAKAPWSWGRVHDIFRAFFWNGARSNPVANYEKERERKKQPEKSKLETKQKKARPRTTSDARARSNSKTRSQTRQCEKETRFKGCNVDWTTIDAWSMKSRERSCSKKQGQLEALSPLNVIQAAGHKGEMVWRNEVVDDVAGYHCQAWKCVVSNKGLQKQKKK